MLASGISGATVIVLGADCAAGPDGQIHDTRIAVTPANPDVRVVVGTLVGIYIVSSANHRAGFGTLDLTLTRSD